MIVSLVDFRSSVLGVESELCGDTRGSDDPDTSQ